MGASLVHIDAINEQHVEIDSQVQYAANVLNQHDHTGLRSGFLQPARLSGVW
jgi:hypothetical protein